MTVINASDSGFDAILHVRCSLCGEVSASPAWYLAAMPAWAQCVACWITGVSSAVYILESN